MSRARASVESAEEFEEMLHWSSRRFLEAHRALIRDDEEYVFDLEARLLECRWNLEEAEKEHRWRDIIQYQHAIRDTERELKEAKKWVEEAKAMLDYEISIGMYEERAA